MHEHEHTHSKFNPVQTEEKQIAKWVQHVSKSKAFRYLCHAVNFLQTICIMKMGTLLHSGIPARGKVGLHGRGTTFTKKLAPKKLWSYSPIIQRLWDCRGKGTKREAEIQAQPILECCKCWKTPLFPKSRHNKKSQKNRNTGNVC